MVALYITSFERGVGKTTICAGLGKHLLGDGRKIGFFKPLIADTNEPPREDIDSDVAFIKGVFALEGPVEPLCPVIIDEGNLTDNVKQAYAKVSQGKDVVIIEGICEQSQTCSQISKALEARVVVVAGYSRELPRAGVTDGYKDFGENLLGVVLNKVPRSQLERVTGELPASLGEAGISILGVLPEDRALASLTIGELAEHVHGEILNCTEQAAELVENFMLGAMVVDSGLEYFNRKINKAAVLRSERPDMQLAALETPIRCLVLSGDTEPIHDVFYRAEEKKVPIISTKEDVATIVTIVEDALDKSRLNQEKKLPQLTEIMEQHFNFQAVYRGLGLIR